MPRSTASAPAGFAGIAIGFIVYGIIILVGPITGAALNPARQWTDILEMLIGGAAPAWDALAVVFMSRVRSWVAWPAPSWYEFIGREAPAPATSQVGVEARAKGLNTK